MNELILGLFWMFYYAMHSAMASRRFKHYLEVSAPAFYPYYRSVYSFFAAINFILLLWLHTIVQSAWLFEVEKLRFVGIGFFLAAMLVFGIAGKTYGAGFLFREAKSPELIRSGLNAYVRHPLYFGIILALIGLILVAPSWKNLVFSFISTLYLILGTLLEERKLIEEFGREYLDYKEEVKMLIPWII